MRFLSNPSATSPEVGKVIGTKQPVQNCLDMWRQVLEESRGWWLVSSSRDQFRNLLEPEFHINNILRQISNNSSEAIGLDVEP